MKILAMDLSLNCPGFAVLDASGGKLTLLHTVAVNNTKDAAKPPEKRKGTARKLQEIARQIHQLILIHHPDVVVRERGFSRFPAATQSLFRVVGVSDLMVFDAAHQEIYELAPSVIKLALTSSGSADKAKVADAIASYVGKRTYITNDESDAVAVGITWAIREGWIKSKLPKKNSARKPKQRSMRRHDGRRFDFRD